ncbi:hypothetical protein ONS95_001519 [Cadophora gregata]|uniref:uncharacterized protein n=1 Tax=Cadophora gregata TaxID=51156 RepID=UPI0026DC0B94|nr:uncharacterized protein ONS95_001519 [Cadophora gregata]KAK0111143.1 hypothetical protein ONS95_001519 [Cadophora gregata]KAK0112390.1 hypothetical protein ONS96_001634 [Cadophora gregata f. sp. sojae]
MMSHSARSDHSETIRLQEDSSIIEKNSQVDGGTPVTTGGDGAPKEGTKRFRKGGPKSRNACVVCKIRRVKCDEVKPACNKCTSTGRICEGYAPPVAKPSKPAPRAQLKLLPGPRIIPNPSAELQGDIIQRRSFHYFRARHMAETPGNFEPAFWETLVLKFSHSFPTVKQSLVALSCMYEEYERCHASRPVDSFQFSGSAIHQYTIAVRELVNYIASDKQDNTVTLISCLIFVWIELLQGNFPEAYRHLKGGMKIINDTGAPQEQATSTISRKREPCHDVKEIQGSLSRSFARLRIQAIVCGQHMPAFSPPCSKGGQVFSSIPHSFGHIFHSRIYLDNEYSCIFEFFRSIKDIDHENEEEMRAMQERKDFRLERLRSWEAANGRMVAESVPAEGHPYSSGVLYLDLYYTAISVILKTMCAPSEMVFDDYLNEFQHIYNSSELLIQKAIAGTPMLSLDMCVIPPLCMIVCTCRFLPLRLEALKLLESTPDREGMWDRVTILKLCREKINIEEEGRGDMPESEPLPEDARIYRKRIVYRNKGRHDAEVLRYFYLGRGPVEVEFFEKADLTKGIVDIKIRNGVADMVK